jgi:hypothetical protein
MKYRKRRRSRRSGHFDQINQGTRHTSASIAQVAATLYFRLASGSTSQRQAAADWKTMFLQLGEGAER